MKHYVLFHANGYNGLANVSTDALAGFEDKIGKLVATSEETLKLGPYSMLFDRENDVAMFGKFVAAAEAQHLKYTVKYLSKD